MILVDTSVLINYFKCVNNAKEQLFEAILTNNLPFGISAYTYQEILQGARNKSEYEKLKEYLSTQTIYFLPETKKTYETAARMYFDLRRTGITPRSTIDILIALTAIEFNLMLLHDDKDFDEMADKFNNLQILKAY